jgi:hypothetical protein
MYVVKAELAPGSPFQGEYPFPNLEAARTFAVWLAAWLRWMGNPEIIIKITHGDELLDHRTAQHWLFNEYLEITHL